MGIALSYGMNNSDRIKVIRHKYELLRPLMTERMRRQWAACEAMSFPRGGFTLVAQATGLSRTTLWAGKRELQHQARLPPEDIQPELIAYRKTNPRRPLKIALMAHPCFDGKTLRWGEKEWRFRKQAGPVQWLLSALERNGWESVRGVGPYQTILAQNEVGLRPGDVRDAAKYLRKKTMPILNWHASNDGTFCWSVP